MSPRSNGEKLLDCCAIVAFAIGIIVALWLMSGCAPLAIVPAVTMETGTPAGAAVTTETDLPSPTIPAAMCAFVTANTALNLRDAPGTHGRVIGYLYHGDRLRIVSYDQSDPGFPGLSLSAWWKVRTGEGLEGWSRSTFLNQSICKTGE